MAQAATPPLPLLQPPLRNHQVRPLVLHRCRPQVWRRPRFSRRRVHRLRRLRARPRVQFRQQPHPTPPSRCQQQPQPRLSPPAGQAEARQSGHRPAGPLVCQHPARRPSPPRTAAAFSPFDTKATYTPSAPGSPGPVRFAPPTRTMRTTLSLATFGSAAIAVQEMRHPRHQRRRHHVRRPREKLRRRHRPR